MPVRRQIILAALVVAAGGGGLGLTLASVFGDFRGWWIIGLAAVSLVELFLLAQVWRRA